MQRTAPEMTANARSLRRNATPAERLLWNALRSHRPRFTRQLVVGDVIIDIACRSVRIAIELDGGHHAMQTKEDRTRTAYFEARGWMVMRFWNNDVLDNAESVAEVILAAVAQASTHPRPLPSREGRRRASS
jgi:very-short-patch-repair endonuclease